MISLSRLMTDMADEQVIAIRNGEEVTAVQFRQDVCATMAGLYVEKLIVFEKSSYGFLIALMAALHSGSEVILPPNDLPATLEKLEGKRVVVAAGPEVNCRFAELDPNGLSLDFYTSGSTGESKSIRKGLFQLENEISVLEDTWGATLGKAHVLATVSHQHIYGMLFKVLWSVCAGRPFVDEMFEYWENLCPHLTQESFIVSSPAHLSRFPQLDRPGEPLMVFSSGGPLSLDAAELCGEALGIIPTEVFGSTETGGVAYRQQFASGVAWQAFDVIEITTDELGVLSIRSPYLENNDWYEMSDRIEFDDDGKFHLRGRVDRIVKVEGKRVSLPEVENALLSLDWIVESCCLITPDERKSLSAVVVLSEAGKQKLEESGAFRLGRFLRLELSDKLDQAARPRRWRFVDKIPVNSQGKRLMADLLALY